MLGYIRSEGVVSNANPRREMDLLFKHMCTLGSMLNHFMPAYAGVRFESVCVIISDVKILFHLNLFLIGLMHRYAVVIPLDYIMLHYIWPVV